MFFKSIRSLPVLTGFPLNVRIVLGGDQLIDKYL